MSEQKAHLGECDIVQALDCRCYNCGSGVFRPVYPPAITRSNGITQFLYKCDYCGVDEWSRRRPTEDELQ